MKNSNDTIGNRTRDLPACSLYLKYHMFSQGYCDEMLVKNGD